MIKIGNALKGCVLLVGTVMGLYGINAVLPPLTLTPGALTPGAGAEQPRPAIVRKNPSATRQTVRSAALTPSWHMRGARQIERRTRTTGQG